MGNETILPGVKRPGREAEHSSPSSAEITRVSGTMSVVPIHLHGVHR